MKRTLRTTATAIGTAATLMIAGCGATGAGQGEGKGSISLGMFNFDELIAITNLWSVVLEDQGYEVDIESAEKAPVFLGLSDGAYDAVLSIWEDADAVYIDEYGDDVVDLGTWNDEAALTIAVNTDAPVDSGSSELSVGAPMGWGCWW